MITIRRAKLAGADDPDCDVTITIAQGQCMYDVATKAQSSVAMIPDVLRSIAKHLEAELEIDNAAINMQSLK